MRILMIARSTLHSSPGGDTTQVEMTAKYLRKLGVEVDVHLSNDKLNYRKYDLLHFFNIIRPDDILPHVLKANIPFVVSTIFVDYFEYEQKNRKGLLKIVNNLFDRDQIEYIKAIARFLKNGNKIRSFFYLFNGHKRSIRYLSNKSCILLPNSHSEYKRFIEAYSVNPPYKKVVNAIDPIYFSRNIEPNNKYKDHILCVGRIEGRKNQLNLIKAVKDTNIPLTIIGKSSPNHYRYFEECVELAKSSPNIKFINHIEHEELAAIYKAARVHASTSWFETTGLTSLEAGAMGCNIVITKKGDTEEYFKDFAYYCEPGDLTSIKDAVLKAYNSPRDLKFQEHILSNYTWHQTALQTLDAYNFILTENILEFDKKLVLRKGNMIA